jgi:hypothetical protein
MFQCSAVEWTGWTSALRNRIAVWLTPLLFCVLSPLAAATSCTATLRLLPNLRCCHCCRFPLLQPAMASSRFFARGDSSEESDVEASGSEAEVDMSNQMGGAGQVKLVYSSSEVRSRRRERTQAQCAGE